MQPPDAACDLGHFKRTRGSTQLTCVTSPTHTQVLYTEYQNNLEVSNEQLDQLRNQLLSEGIKKKGG